MLSHPVAESPLSKGYYIRDGAGHITGPFSTEELRRRAATNQLQLSWHLSTDRVQWEVAAKVQKLFDVVESALARQLPPGKRLRDLTRSEQVGLLIDRFVLRDGDFLAQFPWLKPLRRVIARWTLPRSIVLAQVTGADTRFVQYDSASGTETVLDQDQANHLRSDKVRSSSLFPLLLLGLVLLWAVWVVKDFSLSWVAVKTLAVSAVGLFGKIRDVRRTRVLVGYDLDAATKSRLLAVRQAFRSLSDSSGVWLCRLEALQSAHERKQAAGMDVKVSKMPAVVFSRAIPNVDTNVRITGLTFEDRAIYFLPENILVKEGGSIRYVDYNAVGVQATTFDINDMERKAYPDAQLLGYGYRIPNLGGGRDKRYTEANNPQDVPIYRFGRLLIGLGESSVDLLLTNQAVTQSFEQKFRSRPTVPTATQEMAAGKKVTDEAVEGAEEGEEQQSFKEWMTDVVLPALAGLRAVPRPIWVVAFVLAVLALFFGSLYYAINASDFALERANSLYDAGKRGEAVMVYRQQPQRLLRSDGSGARYLRRLIEYDVERGDLAEAKGWIEKSLEANMALEFNDAKTAELYRSLKAEHDRRVAEARAAEEARRKAAAEEAERRQQEEKRLAEEERQRREETAEKLRAEQAARERVAKEARERAEQEALARAKREQAEQEEIRRKEEIARLDKKATPFLRYAKKLIDEGMLAKAKDRLEEIIRDYPGTPAADEAKRLREKLAKN